ncbi:unnamed protein product [Didymodactylos carnosus]|uniref:Uncharacterized protein n=1 Tax=Didymodactylos carnosus TaxID=1234261 RepID=A0A813V0W3_9BILA|nr:unnamed protein product [Didymodactylos carnosus]CAF1161171.1 unnamed protein product [Didymodactylos carnosus]CAF3617856.1 unnamed protein product [Didymodactylos carnosus]CAF3973006.1 unnamed protein product [Didymodactylos carnosus]
MFNQYFGLLFSISLIVGGNSTINVKTFVDASHDEDDNYLQEIEDQNDELNSRKFYYTIFSYVVNLPEYFLRIVIQTLRIRMDLIEDDNETVDISSNALNDNNSSGNRNIMTPKLWLASGVIQDSSGQKSGDKQTKTKQDDGKNDKILRDSLLKQPRISKVLTVAGKDSTVIKDDDCLLLFYFFVTCYFLCILLLFYILYWILKRYFQKRKQHIATTDGVTSTNTTLLFKTKNYNNQLNSIYNAHSLVELVTPLLTQTLPSQYQQNVTQSTPSPSYV